MPHQTTVFHISPEELLIFIHYPILHLTPKADGIQMIRQIPMIKNCSIERMKMGVDIIIDIYPKILNSIRECYPLVPSTENVVTSLEQLQELMIREKEAFQNRPIELSWYPKPIYQLDMRKICPDELLRFMEKSLDVGYPTDGWVIKAPHQRRTYKLKPIEQMTIDLLHVEEKWISSDRTVYTVNECADPVSFGIYRLQWKNMGWEVREKRDDKIIPNPDFVIDQLEKFHKFPWKPTDLIPYLNYAYYIHTKPDVNDHIINYLTLQKEITIKIILSLSPLSILDLGCGKGFISKISDIDYLGIDIDPLNISKGKYQFRDIDPMNISKGKYQFRDIDPMNISKSIQHQNKSGTSTNKITFHLGDINNPNWSFTDPIFNKLDPKSFDMIVMNFSIHNVKNLAQLFYNLQSWTKTGSYLLITMMEDDGKTFTDLFTRNEDHTITINYPWIGEQLTESWHTVSDIITISKDAWIPVHNVHLNERVNTEIKSLNDHQNFIQRILLVRT